MSVDDKLARYKRQIERICEDPEGLRLIGERLGLVLKKHEELKGKPTVAVLTPTYDGCHPRMTSCTGELINYSQKFATVWREPVRGSSLISWVRNDMVTVLYKPRPKPFTHVLWIDDDMIFEKEWLVQMLRRDVDVCGALYTYRSDPPMPNVHAVELATTRAKRLLRLDQKDFKVTDGLLRASELGWTITAGTAFLLVKREVFDKVGEFYLDCQWDRLLWGLKEEQWRAISKMRRESFAETGNAWWFELLPRLSGYAQVGEDTSFCIKAAMCGFDVAVDSAIRPGHMGEYCYGWDDYVAHRGPEVKKAQAEEGLELHGPDPDAKFSVIKEEVHA